MAGSLPLWLRLRLSALRPAGPKAKAAVEAGQGEDRADAPLLWIWAAGTCAEAAGLVARRVAARMPDIRIAMTVRGSESAPDGLPDQVFLRAAPEDRPASVRLVLDAWRPDLVLIMDETLPAALIAETQTRGIASVLADAKFGGQDGLRLDDVSLALLGRIDRIYLRDEASLERVDDRLSGPVIVVNDGALGEPPQPLHGSEAERASMAESMGARPVWLAAAVPEAEVGPVTAAHRYAQRHAHRLLLLLVPDDESQGEALAAQLTAEGWSVARRSLEGEPELTTEIFIADDAQEYGLWYRLAALSYMGGTLSGTAQSPRSPVEAAALGSAILHGPKLAPFREDYLRLEAAKACRGVVVPEDLPEVVADLIAPERSAQLAHNAWAVTSGGAGAVETIARDLAEILSGTQPARVA